MSDKPRRMQANPRATCDCGLVNCGVPLHCKEHEEGGSCSYWNCQPVTEGSGKVSKQQMDIYTVSRKLHSFLYGRLHVHHETVSLDDLRNALGKIIEQQEGSDETSTYTSNTERDANPSTAQDSAFDAAPPTPATRGKEQEQAHKSLNDYCAEVHKANAKWWVHLDTGIPLDRNFGELIALVHSELSEALEGHRKNLMDDKLPHRKMVEVELADTVIRIFDICAGLGFDLDGAYQEKMAYNAVREDHKKEARLKANGKKY